MDVFTSIDLTAYTDGMMIHGTVKLPYRRVVDLLNSQDREYLSIEQATATPLVLPSQVTGPNANATVVRRDRVILAGMDREGAAPLADDSTARRMAPAACLGFIGAFVFHAHLPMLPNQRLVDVMEVQRDDFMLFYDATLYLAERPELPPRAHAGIAVNRHYLDALYLL
jgi:hypothetical protein